MSVASEIGAVCTHSEWARLGRDVEAFHLVPCRIDIGPSAVRPIVSRTYLAAMALRLETWSSKVQRCEWVDAQRRQTESMDLPIKFKNQRTRNMSRTLNNQASREVEKCALGITPLSICKRSETIGVAATHWFALGTNKTKQTLTSQLSTFFPTSRPLALRWRTDRTVQFLNAGSQRHQCG